MNEEEKIQFNNLVSTVEALTEKLKERETQKPSTDMYGLVRILGGELMVGGGVAKDLDEVVLPLSVVDDPGVDNAKNAYAMGVNVSNRGLKLETIEGLLGVGKMNKEVPSNLSSGDRDPNFSNDVSDGAGLYLQHRPYDISSYLSFFYAIRPPSFSSQTGRITNGGSILTDILRNLNVNELVGATLFIQDTANSSQGEAFIIASNTATTITISGTFAGATGEYTYIILRPVYLGYTVSPWQRLYLQGDIRFGIGPSNASGIIFIKYGSGSPEGVIVANIGSLYMRTDGGSETSLYIKESGTGNTGWIPMTGTKEIAQTATSGLADGFTLTPVTKYHTLAGTAARTSDTTTAINDGTFAGQLLILEGTSDANTITIKDSANTKLAGDCILGINDTLTLIWNGSDWVELARSNN